MCSVTQSYLIPCDPMVCAHQAPLSMGLLRQEYWSGLHFLLQGIFPTQQLNPYLWHLLHWQAQSLSLSYLGSPRSSAGNFQNCYA